MRLGLVGAALLLALVGCGGTDDSASSAETESSLPVAPTSTTTVTETAQAPVPVCEPPSPQEANVVAARWSLVIASRGAVDHEDLVADFTDSVNELAEDFEDGGCDGEDAASTASMLAYQASLVAAYALVGGGDKYYDEAAKVGNQMLDQMGSDDVRFIPLSCTGKVDTTPVCTAL